MAALECILPRRQALAVAAILAAFPSLGEAIATEADAQRNPIYGLLAEFRLLTGLYAAKACAVDALELSIEDDPDLWLFCYEDESKLADFSPEERERIQAADLWSVASGHDALVKELNEIGARLTATEVAIMTTRPRSIGAVADVLTWLASRQAKPAVIGCPSALDRADHGIYEHLADSLRALVS
jgi:hypothetical protein